MTPSTPAVQVKGIAVTDANVRIGPKKDDKAVDKLLKGGEVVVIGFAFDPNAGEYQRRFQIEHKGETRWVAAKLVLLDPIGFRQLPFLPLDLADPEAALLQSVGVNPKEVPMSLDEAVTLVKTLGNVELRGTWTRADLDEVCKMLADLENYGVILTGEDQGKWSLDELRTVYEALTRTAKGTGALFDTIFGLCDDAMAFRILYAPLTIARSPKDNVSVVQGQVWYAKNSNGYEITLSNKVFFKGTQTTKTNRDLPYTSMELIAHEIGHVINWRYPRKRHEGKRLLDKPSVYYPKKVLLKEYTLSSGEKVALGSLNAGYAMAARSSNGEHETVTDAIACLSLDRFTIDSTDAKKQLQGRARKEQITAMMNDIIRYRIRDYGEGSASLREEILARWKQPLLDRMSPGLALIADKLDADLATLKAKLEVS
jgi:hypothetical protein